MMAGVRAPDLSCSEHRRDEVAIVADVQIDTEWEARIVRSSVSMPDESPKTRRAFITRLNQLCWTPGERTPRAVTPFARENPYIKAAAGDLEQRIEEHLMRCAHEDDRPPIHVHRPARVVRPSQE
jgi:hypothetical protein